MGLGWAPGIFSPVASEDHPETRESALEGRRIIHIRGGRSRSQHEEGNKNNG